MRAEGKREREGKNTIPAFLCPLEAVERINGETNWRAAEERKAGGEIEGMRRDGRNVDRM